MKKLFLIVSVSLSASINASERLTSDELKEFYTEKTMIVVHHKLGPGRAYYGTDGTVRSISDSGEDRIGIWWIDESKDLRCLRWNHKNKDFCHYTDRNGDGTHALIHRKNGKTLVEFNSSVPGNQL